MNKIKLTPYITLLGILSLLQTVHAQEVITLESAPASADMVWERAEEVIEIPNTDDIIVANVSEPSITVYLPPKEKANGTALIIAPGGGFHMLSFTNEGTAVAKWCAEQGIVAFVLKYRLVPTHGNPLGEFREKISNQGSEQMDREIAPFVELAKADGLAAIEYVREHASEFGVQPDKIGIIGFSAGGSVAGAAAFEYEDASNRPDFSAPIYPALQVVDTSKMPEEPMPLFVAVTSDDTFGFQTLCTQLYNQWSGAGESMELHIYDKGGHGFGMRKQNLPSDKWIMAFGEWLDSKGLIAYE